MPPAPTATTAPTSTNCWPLPAAGRRPPPTHQGTKGRVLNAIENGIDSEYPGRMPGGHPDRRPGPGSSRIRRRPPARAELLPGGQRRLKQRRERTLPWRVFERSLQSGGHLTALRGSGQPGGSLDSTYRPHRPGRLAWPCVLARARRLYRVRRRCRGRTRKGDEVHRDDPQPLPRADLDAGDRLDPRPRVLRGRPRDPADVDASNFPIRAKGLAAEILERTGPGRPAGGGAVAHRPRVVARSRKATASDHGRSTTFSPNC